jgi:hypothetical protein
MKFTCIKPAVVGTSPANETGASSPPTVTWVVSFSLDSGNTGAKAPVATGLSTGPDPIAYITANVPGAAQFVAEFTVESSFSTTARFPL